MHLRYILSCTSIGAASASSRTAPLRTILFIMYAFRLTMDTYRLAMSRDVPETGRDSDAAVQMVKDRSQKASSDARVASQKVKTNICFCIGKV